MSDADRWASLIAGGMLALSGLRRHSGGRFMMLLGAEMLRRGLTGHCFAYEAFGVRTRRVQQGASVSVPYELGVRVRTAITIARPRHEIYAFWRNLENLPRVMSHLISVRQNDARHSHWVAKGPADKQVEWDAEIINEVENELIAWRSLRGSRVDSAGSVQFKDASGGRGTEVTVELQYNPPAGFVGASIAKLFGRDPSTEIESDLFRLKQFLETGEVATVDGQPHGESTSPASSRWRPQAKGAAA